MFCYAAVFAFIAYRWMCNCDEQVACVCAEYFSNLTGSNIRGVSYFLAGTGRKIDIVFLVQSDYKLA